MLDGRGAPLPGVQLHFSRTGGVRLSSDSFTVVTDGEGQFVTSVAADQLGPVMVDLVVEPPTGDGYRVEAIELRATRRGDRLYFGKWGAHPYVSALLEVYLRGDGRPLDRGEVVFRATGGARVDTSTVEATTTRQGLFWVATAAEPGTIVVGELEAQARRREEVLRSGQIHLPIFEGRPQSRYVRVPVGPHLAAAGRVHWADTGQPAADVEVAFRRTAGLRVEPDSFVTRTDQNGVFAFRTAITNPFVGGDVVGRLHINPPAPYLPVHLSGFRVPTHEADEMRLVGHWDLQRNPDIPAP